VPDKLFYVFYPLTFARVNVPLFFVISGFVIHLSFLQARGGFDVKRFYVRRFWRIYPPYLLALLFFTVLERVYADGREGALQFFSHLLFVHNLHDRSFFGINPAFWSLAVEVQMYLLFPLLLWIRARVGMTRAFVFTLALSVLWQAGAFLVTDWGSEIRWSVWMATPRLWFDWTIGAYLAERYVAGKGVHAYPRVVAVGVVFLFFACTLFKPFSVLTFTLASLIAAGFLERYVRRETALGRIEKLFVPLGLCSYSSTCGTSRSRAGWCTRWSGSACRSTRSPRSSCSRCWFSR
jgi:peptidoglycan/LPS O-acetylase OafA/YrhL